MTYCMQNDLSNPVKRYWNKDIILCEKGKMVILRNIYLSFLTVKDGIVIYEKVQGPYCWSWKFRNTLQCKLCDPGCCVIINFDFFTGNYRGEGCRCGCRSIREAADIYAMHEKRVWWRKSCYDRPCFDKRDGRGGYYSSCSKTGIPTYLLLQ